MSSRELGTDALNTKRRKHRSFRYLRKLKKKEQTEILNAREQKILKELEQIYPLCGLKSAMKKLNNVEDDITDQDLAIVIRFVDIFSSVSLHPSIVGSKVAEIAKIVNQHKHTKTCRKYLTICRFKFPKLPFYKTLIARPPDKSLSLEDRKTLEDKYGAILKKVKECLNDKDEINRILAVYPKEAEGNLSETIEGRNKRIDALLVSAGLTSVEEKQLYQEALEYSSAGYSIVMARDIDEIYVNSYNPEITRAWNGNTDFQICLDFYAIITYICEYITKDDTGIIKVLVNTLKANDCDDLKQKMILLMNTWIKHRQMGEAEAVYRLVPEFKFRDSDTKCVFVQTCPRTERSKILKNATDKPEYANMPKVYVDNNDTEYIEQYDINSKYERLPKEEISILKTISFSQFVKIYEPCWGKRSNGDTVEVEDKVFEEPNIDVYTQEVSATLLALMPHITNSSDLIFRL